MLVSTFKRISTSLGVFCVLCSTLVLSGTAAALPWDIDMYRQESYQSNEMVRAPVPGTVPVGHKPFTMSIQDADTKLENPVAFDRMSVWRGKRLWNANCLTCHAADASGKSKVAESFVGIPDLLTDLYSQRSDGRIFAVIYHGQNAMPRYGYKFSAQEQWDIINYLRFLQGRDVEGMKRPMVEAKE